MLFMLMAKAKLSVKSKL